MAEYTTISMDYDIVLSVDYDMAYYDLYGLIH